MVVCLLSTACTPTNSPVTPTVESRLAAEPASPIDPASTNTSQGDHPRPARLPRSNDDVLAHVNGRKVSRSEFDALLLQSRGLAILEPLIVLEAAEAEAARQRIPITQAMIDQEYDLSLRQLLNPQSSPDAAGALSDSERDQGERVLNTHLNERNLSHAEFQLAVRRNTVLRALAGRQVRVTSDDIERESRKLIGPRVQIRHIQLTSIRDAQLVLEKLRNGEPFETLARQLSANPQSASQDGLMAPFTADDPQVPVALRQAAFALADGQISDPIRVDPWYHLIKLEKGQAIRPLTPEEAKTEAANRLRTRLLPDAMQSLYRSLLESADIRFRDPLLAELWRERNSPQQGR